MSNFGLKQVAGYERQQALVGLLLRDEGERHDGDAVFDQRFGLVGVCLPVDRPFGFFARMHRFGFGVKCVSDIVCVGFDMFFDFRDVFGHSTIAFLGQGGGHNRFLDLGRSAGVACQHPAFLKRIVCITGLKPAFKVMPVVTAKCVADHGVFCLMLLGLTDKAEWRECNQVPSRAGSNVATILRSSGSCSFLAALRKGTHLRLRSLCSGHFLATSSTATG